MSTIEYPDWDALIKTPIRTEETPRDWQTIADLRVISTSLQRNCMTILRRLGGIDEHGGFHNLADPAVDAALRDLCGASKVAKRTLRRLTGNEI